MITQANVKDVIDAGALKKEEVCKGIEDACGSRPQLTDRTSSHGRAQTSRPAVTAAKPVTDERC